MPNTVAGWGVGGGTAGMPATSADNRDSLASLVSSNPRPVSLNPGEVKTGVVNAASVGSPLLPIVRS